MLNKKTLFVLAVIINIIITFFSSVNVWADDTPAGDEYQTIANSLPDALILLDLSGSMLYNPAGTAYPYGADTSCSGNTTLCNNPTDTTFVYSHDATCTPDTGNCHGTGSTTYTYAHDGNCTLDTVNCVGTYGSTYKYAHDSTCKPSTTYCTGTSGTTTCSGGYCSGTAHSNCTTDCSKFNCSGGFCQYYSSSSPHTPSGCATLCNCQGGMCQGSVTNCANQCATNKCDAVNGFCNDTSQPDCSTACSKIAIAKRALFSILDDNDDNIIDANDMTSMGIRIGYMRFISCSSNESSLSYTAGCNTLIDVISAINNGVSSNNQTSYALTYCGNSTTSFTCNQTVTSCPSSCTSGSTTCNTACIVGENVSSSGGTPLATALKEAKLYLDTHKAGDAYKSCRQKFVILVTDGQDDLSCPGSDSLSECRQYSYQRRRESVAATKALDDAGYKVFVVGFGSQMPSYLQNTLNWMAYYGGTDNPLTVNSPKSNLNAYSIPWGCQNTPSVSSACCTFSSTSPYGSTNSSGCYPKNSDTGKTQMTSCQTDTSAMGGDETATCTGIGAGSIAHFEAVNNDPGYLDLAGYAFLAGDTNALTASLKSAIDTIKAATYSFTHASVQAQRTTDENYLYEASFEPLATDPLWIGHLKRFSLNTDGSIPGNSDWDAGAVLQGVVDNGVSSPRLIYTYTTTDGTLSNSGVNTFTSGFLPDAILGTTTDADRNNIIKFIRRGDTNYTTDSAFYRWKLGDILHASPLTIPTPNYNFYDRVDLTSYGSCYDTTNGSCDLTCTSGKAFTQYLCQHIRKTSISGAAGNRIILIGANDGQLHAFKTYNGSEAWSFIPPNLLSRLSYISHNVHPTDESHTYFVDGPMGAAEVWVPPHGTDPEASTYTSANAAIGTTAKSYSDWHTYLVLSEGRGGISTLWSQYASCACPSTAANCTSSGTNPGFSTSYSSTYKYYCGFYALDLTETSTTAPLVPPAFKWALGGRTGLLTSNTYDQPAFWGQPWSKMFFGRVRINNNETWVGLIGAGYSGTNCAGTTTCSDKRGKGFYVVDLSNGNILWSFTHDGSGNAGNTSMDYNLVAGPVGIDTDNDGFIDTAYVGDLGGNVWRFKFCLASQGTSCNVSSWTGGLFFNNH